MDRRVEWDDMRFFLAVARAGRFNAAAQALGVDQATVGRRIARLEERLGAPLFQRNADGLTPSDEGLRLLPAAEQMEKGALAAVDAIDARDESLSGAVRIGAPVGAASHLLADGAVALSRAHPKLELQIVALPVQHSLSKREADLAITVTPPEHGRLLQRKIAAYRLRVYAAEGYLANRPAITSREDLLGLDWIGYIPDLILDKNLDILPSIDPRIQPKLTSANIHVQLQFTLAQGGLCVLHDFMARDYPSLLPVLPEELNYTRAYWLVLHEDHRQVRRIRRVADFLADHLAARLSAASRA